MTCDRGAAAATHSRRASLPCFHDRGDFRGPQHPKPSVIMECAAPEPFVIMECED